MRISGQARIKLSQGEEFELDLAGWDFPFETTWEPSLDVIDIYAATVKLGGVSVRLELMQSDGPFGDGLSLRVRPAHPSVAQVVHTSVLARRAEDAALAADPVVSVAPRSREAHLAAYQAACEDLAQAARAAWSVPPEGVETLDADARARDVLAAVEAMAALPRPFGASHVDAARRLFFDTGYFETEVVSVPADVSAAAVVAVMLALSDDHRGVDAYDSPNTRKSYRSRPAQLNAVAPAALVRVEICTQFSTRSPGGTRPGVVYDQGAGGFVFDGPRAARDAFRDAITRALQEERERHQRAPD